MILEVTKHRIMLLSLVIGLIVLVVSYSEAQTRTAINDGNWSETGRWQGGNIGGAVDNDDDIVMNANVDLIIQDGESYTVASLNVGKDGSLTIEEGGSFTVTGDVIVDKDFTINVDGVFTIESNLDVAKDLVLNVGTTGTMDILGDVNLAKDATLDVQGAMEITGSFTAAQGAVVNVGDSGSLDVGEELNLGSGSVITGNGPVTAGSCTGEACTDPQLPIILADFSATVIDANVYLYWTTESEENFDYFDIQRSLDGVEYNSIGTLPGNGNSKNRIDYSFEDINPLFGEVYYRLVAVDLDGTFEIFNAINVNYVPDALMLNIYPNPSSDNFFSMNFGLPTLAQTKYMAIFDLSGNMVEQWHLMENNEQMHSDLAPGIYLVKIQIDNYMLTRRLILN